MKCVFSWEPQPHLKEYFLSETRALEVVFVDRKNKEKLKASLIDAEVMVGWTLDLEILKAASKLKYIFYPGAGFQQIKQEQIDYIKEKNIIFTNSHGNAFATAQHACALLLSVANKIVLHHDFTKNGKWRTGDKEGKSFSLRGKTIGLLGFGQIGKFIFRMLSGFDCKFIIYKNSNKIKKQYENQVEVFSNEAGNLSDFLMEADVFISSMPGTPITENLINKENIKYLKSSVLVVNVGRGSVINEEALYHSLKEKDIAGAGIDVWYNYRPEADDAGKKFPFNFPFQELDNVVLSPHRGASPMDDPYRFYDIIYNLSEILNENPKLKNVVNLENGY